MISALFLETRYHEMNLVIEVGDLVQSGSQGEVYYLRISFEGKVLRSHPGGG